MEVTKMADTYENKVTNCFKITGKLLHDNKLFDRTCSKCKGMYSSYIHRVCPKCDSDLTFITTKIGTPMAISEGTISMSLGERTRARADHNIKNGPYVKEEYRFKIISFGDKAGNLAPPTNHKNFINGSIVEACIFNHPQHFKVFTNGKGEPKVEVMLFIYADYKDYVEVLEPATIEEATISNPVNNTQKGANPNQDRINVLEKDIAEIREMFKIMMPISISQEMQFTSWQIPIPEIKHWCINRKMKD